MNNAAKIIAEARRLAAENLQPSVGLDRRSGSIDLYRDGRWVTVLTLPLNAAGARRALRLRGRRMSARPDALALAAALARARARAALDLRGAVVTFGTLRASTPAEVEERGPSSSLVPFIHCWVEVGEALYAPTLIERTGGELRSMRRAAYYDLNGVTNPRAVPPAAFAAIARRFGLAAALRHGSQRFGDGRVTEALLTAAGVRYRLGENRALLPK